MRREPYLFAHLTSSEVEKYRKEVGVLLLPVGATEQHSDYTVVGTDFIQAQYVAEEVARRTGTLALPPVSYGNSYYHSEFPGTIYIRPMTFIEFVADIIRSVFKQGFKALLIINGHGGNTALLKTAVHRVKEEGLEGRVEVIDWFMLPGVREIEDRYFGEKNGVHVTAGEVSCNLAMFFEDFSVESICIPSSCPEYGIYSAKEFRKRYPHGIALSDPNLARKEIGKEILEIAIEELSKIVGRFKDEVCRSSEEEKYFG